MGASAGSSIMPSCSSEISNSRSEHNMPLDGCPRIRPFDKIRLLPSSSVIPGMAVPTGAKTARMPVRALGAPQTTSMGSPPLATCPISTLQTRSLSALGCCSALITWATKKGSKAWRGLGAGDKSSISNPMAVSVWASSGADAGGI